MSVLVNGLLLLVPPKRFTHPVTKCFFLVSGTAVISAPIVLGAVGFTSAGIAAAAPVASGGVAAGSAVAVLHSAGQKKRKKKNPLSW